MAEKHPRRQLTLGAKELVRFSYVHVFDLHVNSQSGNEEYSVQLLIPKTSTDGKTVADGIAEIRKEMFADKRKPVPPKFRNPLRDGDKDVRETTGEPYGPAAEGHYILSAKAYPERPPKVVGTSRDADGKLAALTDGGVKSGDYGRVGITLCGYMTGDTGVRVELRTLQLVQAGEPLGNEADPDADFGGFEDEPNVL